jgi:peptide-methionine (R)-S-oxide reductase
MHNPYFKKNRTEKLNISNEEWCAVLSPELYHVARQQGTECAFASDMWQSETKGKYYCACCGNYLFASDAKFTSSCGWPSYFEPSEKNAVYYREDLSYGMQRVEVLCSMCDSHLGHVFDDGPAPTQLRYCINAISVFFEPQ